MEEAIPDNHKAMSGGNLFVDIEHGKTTNGFDAIFKDNKTKKTILNNKGKTNKGSNPKRRRN